MHIRVTGNGPDLILIHGWGLQGEVFAPLVERLSDHLTLHVVDLPGHGHSVDDTTPLRLPYVVNAIARSTPPAVWCGWSLGGLFALHAAATLPGVRGLVMMASAARFQRSADWPFGGEPAVLPQLAQDLSTKFPETLDRFLALDLMAAKGPPGPLQALRGRLLAGGPPAPRALTEGLALLQATDLRGALPQLPCPSLWLAGQRDRLASPAAMQACAMLAPDACSVTIAQGGHAPFLGQPDEVAGLVKQFVAALP